jgi:asparagine synthase (glutamine-hydrolysing)
MCGIAGFVDFSAAPSPPGVLDRMDAALANRGPDGRGSAHFKSAGADVGLAHRRLAIIDLSEGGHQPMSTPNGSSWITYNGEIYNYRSLRDGLVAAGTAIRTASDSEVLLELLTARGLAALPMLRGMFAFAWWDERAARLVLARDRFGIKPLVFAETRPGRWCFASDASTLAASGEMSLRADPTQRDEVLARGAVAADKSFWSDVHAVAPGEAVVIDANGMRRESYWRLEDVLLRPHRATSVNHAAETLRDALSASVSAHLVSDVPVGLFLSGGLDSAAILATVRNIGAGPIRTFTVTMEEQALDESRAARQAAQQFGGEHTELRVSDLDLDRTLDEFFAAMKEPTADGLNTFVVARAARLSGVRVAMSGVGADELLGGYQSFARVPQLSALLRAATPVGRAGLGGAAAMLPGRHGDKIRALAGGSPDVASVWWNYRAVTPRRDGRTVPMPALPAAAAYASPFAVVRYLEYREFLERQLLRDADAFTMAFALELRTPFVDHDVVEAMASAGEWPKDGAKSFKAALFRALPDLTRPGSTLERKQGFVLPMSRWMREALAGVTGGRGSKRPVIATSLPGFSTGEFTGRGCGRPTSWRAPAGELTTADGSLGHRRHVQLAEVHFDVPSESRRVPGRSSRRSVRRR